MSTRVARGVAAVVVGSTGGERLAAVLDAVAWAGERVVVDPSGRMPAGAVPGDVPCVAGLPELRSIVHAPWVLLLDEQEHPDECLAEDVARVTGSEATAAWRIPRELRLGGVRLVPRMPPIRLAPSAGARVTVRADAVLALATRDRAAGTLPGRLVPAGPSSVAYRAGRFDAAGATVAAVLAHRGARPSRRRFLQAPLVAGLCTVGGRAVGRAGWARWILAALEAYGALVGVTKLWERCKAEGMRTPP